MPPLNGNSLGCVLGGCAEHAVVMIDKKEWGHRGRHGTPITPARMSYWKANGADYTCVFIFNIFTLKKKESIREEM